MPPVSRLARPTLSGIGDIVIKDVARLSEWPPVVAAAAAFVQPGSGIFENRTNIKVIAHGHAKKLSNTLGGSVA